MSTARISPTAHYTGYVWYRNGLAPHRFRTWQGQLLYHGGSPFNLLNRLRGGAELEAMLLARHRAIDRCLEQAIEDGSVGQVVEVACGLSPRGVRFSRRFPELRYLEADLPDMAARKRALLEGLPDERANHRVVVVDALRDDGPGSLAQAITPQLEDDRGVAVITEGLLGYFDRKTVCGMWQRFSRFLDGFPEGLYLADIHTRCDTLELPGVRAFKRMLSLFARGRVHLHFEDPGEVGAALEESGFAAGRAPYASELCGRNGVAAARQAGYVRIVAAISV